VGEDTPLQIVLLVSAALLVLILAVPFMLPYGSLTGLDGVPVNVDHWDTWSSMDPLSGSVYLLGDVFCHQEAGRSFFLNGSQIAFCVRDSGALAGLAATSAALLAIPAVNRRRSDFLLFGILLMLPCAADWAIQYAMGWNVWEARLATGFLAGAGLSLMIRYASDALILSVFAEKG
jgi:uncharacterized membrane protein